MKASMIVQSMDKTIESSSPTVNMNQVIGGLNKSKGLKKKKLFTQSGQEYFQIQPLTKMTQLRSFYNINSSLNKLSVNINTRGVDQALMKLGEEFEFEEVPKKAYRQHDSDADSFGK